MSAVEMIASVEVVLTEIEDRLATVGEGISLTLMDRVSMPEAWNNTRLLRGVHVEVPTTDTLASRDQDDALVRDSVIVHLFYRLPPKEQKAGRNQAHRLEDMIRGALTSRSFRPEWHVTYTGTSFRGPESGVPEVYRITQQFTTLRDAELGAGMES